MVASACFVHMLQTTFSARDMINKDLPDDRTAAAPNARRRQLLAMPLALSVAPLRAATMRVVYPRQESAGDQRDDYQALLLKLVLEKSGRPYEVVPHAHAMVQPRLLHELEVGNDLDVAWTMTSTQRERKLLPVRIPVDMGLGGWRLLMVRKSNASRFDAVESLTQLKLLTAGQGADWPDVEILRAAGLPVVTAANYASLFRMLGAGHFDYFPRAVQEIWPELERPGTEELMVEPRLVLRYPTASYFFVNRKRPELAADIERGFELALQDGSYNALFRRHLGPTLDRARLRQRTVLHLNNPLLPPNTPLDVARYWYQP